MFKTKVLYELEAEREYDENILSVDDEITIFAKIIVKDQNGKLHASVVIMNHNTEEELINNIQHFDVNVKSLSSVPLIGFTYGGNWDQIATDELKIRDSRGWVG